MVVPQLKTIDEVKSHSIVIFGGDNLKFDTASLSKGKIVFDDCHHQPSIQVGKC